MIIKLPPVWLILLLVLPVIQLGFSYYISFFIFGFLYLFLLGNFPKIKPRFVVLMIFGFMIFLIKTVSNIEVGTREIFLPLREMLCFAVLIIGLFKVKHSINESKNLQVASFYLLIVIFLVIVVQYVSIQGGIYFGFPFEWFVKNQVTLSGVDAALYHNTRFRPTAFYGEPSYAAFIILSLLFISIECGQSFQIKVVGIVLSTVSVFLLGSGAGLISIVALTILWLWFGNDQKFRKYRYHITFLLFLSIPFFVILNEEFSSRMALIISGDDISILNRLADPFNILMQAIDDGKLIGVTTAYIEDYYAGDFGDGLINNGILWIFLYYGIMAFPLIFIMIKIIGINIGLVYIFLCINFNGDFFIYDKVIVMSLALGAHLYCRKPYYNCK